MSAMTKYIEIFIHWLLRALAYESLTSNRVLDSYVTRSVDAAVWWVIHDHGCDRGGFHQS